MNSPYARKRFSWINRESDELSSINFVSVTKFSGRDVVLESNIYQLEFRQGAK